MNLPASQQIGALSEGHQFIAVCVVKPNRPDYNVRTSTLSGFQLNSDTAEFGYFATAKEFRRQGLAESFVAKYCKKTSKAAFKADSIVPPYDLVE